MHKLMGSALKQISIILGVLLILFLVVLKLIFILEFPYFLRLYLNSLLAFSILGSVYLILVFWQKTDIKSFYDRILFVSFFLLIFINILYPLFLFSSKFFTDRIVTEGIVTDKQQLGLDLTLGNLGINPIDIFELKVMSSNRKLDFDLFNHQQEWAGIKIGDKIRIEHYPYITDMELEIN